MSQLQGLVQRINPRHRIFILTGVIFFVFIYYIIVILTRGTIEQGIVDWNTDQGYTQLGDAIILVVLCFLLILYPYQKIFRNREITKFHAFLMGGIFLFVVLGAFIFRWLSHDLNINFYHSYPLGEDQKDKIAHFLGAFLLTLTILSFSPTKPAVIISWCIPTIYELLEILTNYQTLLWEQADHFGLLYEISDVPYDIIANTLGWLVAIIVVIRIFKKPIR